MDMCAIQRPLDTPDQVRIRLEAEAVLWLIALCDRGMIELISSDALIFETNRNPLSIRRDYALDVLTKAKTVAQVTSDITVRAKQFINNGVKPLDALHLALAESVSVDYFCTCDDRLLRYAKRPGEVKVMVLSPVDLAQELEKWLTN
jgi:predicted nucleic acid-binding protein